MVRVGFQRSDELIRVESLVRYHRPAFAPARLFLFAGKRAKMMIGVSCVAGFFFAVEGKPQSIDIRQHQARITASGGSRREFFDRGLPVQGRAIIKPADLGVCADKLIDLRSSSHHQNRSMFISFSSLPVNAR